LFIFHPLLFITFSANPKYEEVLLEVLEKELLEYGYEFGRWTANRLATYLQQATGIKLSGSQVRRILERKKYVYLWTKYSLEDKQNLAQRKTFKEKLLEYLKRSQEARECLQVWFWNESRFSLRVIRRKTWGQKGSRKKVTGQRRRGRVNMMGGLRYKDKKTINFVI
jgi:hypothetical protein